MGLIPLTEGLKVSDFPVVHCYKIFTKISNEIKLYRVGQLPSIDNKRYFPIFPCVVGLIGY
jgi:hypothetical protein